MKHERVVINASPLITLERIGALEVFGNMPFDFLCPREVLAELAAGKGSGFEKMTPHWLKVHASPVDAGQFHNELDPGESAVIQLALDLNIRTVCIDEVDGRKIARAHGLHVIGLPGMLAIAKQKGLISSVKPLLADAVRRGIHYHPKVVRMVLEKVGEA